MNQWHSNEGRAELRPFKVLPLHGQKLKSVVCRCLRDGGANYKHSNYFILDVSREQYSLNKLVSFMRLCHHSKIDTREAGLLNLLMSQDRNFDFSKPSRSFADEQAVAIASKLALCWNFVSQNLLALTLFFHLIISYLSSAFQTFFCGVSWQGILHSLSFVTAFFTQ